MSSHRISREARFRELVSGQSRGLAPAILRSLLAIAELPYTLAMRVRNWRYDTNPSKVTRVDVPVVCVGNLTLGGTGKTPLVEWIARWFRRHGTRVTIVSRGYGAQHGARNDEALELEERLVDVPHLQNPDRVEAARMAIEEFECELVLLDDGFQHRRLGRDLDIVLLDAAEPLGYGHVFPRGALREPLSGLKRAQVVILSRADLVDDVERRRIRDIVRRYAPAAGWAEVRHAPRELRDAAGGITPAASLDGQRIAAFCGIGNPAGFRHTLDGCGAKIIDFRPYPDHHLYSRADIEELSAWVQSLDVERVVCTHKDLVKIRTADLGAKPLTALVIGSEFLAGQEIVERRLSEIQQRVDAVRSSGD